MHQRQKSLSKRSEERKKKLEKLSVHKKYEKENGRDPKMKSYLKETMSTM